MQSSVNLAKSQNMSIQRNSYAPATPQAVALSNTKCIAENIVSSWIGMGQLGLVSWGLVD
jgi:hypothetical protein